MFIPAKIYQGIPNTTNSMLNLIPFNNNYVPSNSKLIIKQIIITNTSSNQVTVNFNLNTTPVLSNFAVNANSIVVIDLNLVMENGDYLSASQSQQNAVSMIISGVVVY